VTQRNLAIRLSVTDAQKVKATLNDVGESGQRAIKKVEDASRPASKALRALDGATGTLRGTFEDMTARLAPLGGALSRLGPAGLTAKPCRRLKAATEDKTAPTFKQKRSCSQHSPDVIPKMEH
jgi:hypothetical protein